MIKVTCPYCNQEYSEFLNECPHCSTDGVKHTEGKAVLALVPPEAIYGMAEALDYGRHKYSERNWERGVTYSELYRAALSHLFKWWMGEDHDQESGVHHLDHALCCIGMLTTLIKRKTKVRKLNDRPRPVQTKLKNLQAYIRRATKPYESS